MSNGSEGLWKGMATKKVHVYVWKCCRIRAQSLLLGQRCTKTFLLQATSRVILVNILFRFLIFYDRIRFSIEIPFQKCVGCHTSCEQQKSYGKTPREANLYGNWFVRKGLNTKTACAISRDRCSESVGRPVLAKRTSRHVPVLDHGFTPVMTRAARLWRRSKWFMSWAESPPQASWAYSSTGLTDVKYTDRIARVDARFRMRWKRPILCAALLQT